MTNKNKVLYVSYDGMTDALGQSQVIPYLKELAKREFEIHILSAEKLINFQNKKDFISKIFTEANIVWHHINYTKNPPIISSLKDIYCLKKKAVKLNKKYNYKIIHCRSYISAFVGMKMKKKFAAKFLFDMRGFYADERVDGNLWNKKNLVFKLVYDYFKRKEKVFLENADYTVSLTNAGKDIIHNKFNFPNIPIEVIPCCADINHFDYNKISEAKTNELRTKLKISKDDFVLSYLGSIGTWYMLDEMLDFFKVLKLRYKNAKFLFITTDNPENIHRHIEEKNIILKDILIKSANREAVPELLSLSDLSIFFIKPVFSKKASSPTKLAEILGMGVPIVCNSGVGDIDEIFTKNNIGLLVSEFKESEYKNTVDKMEDIININKFDLRKVSENLFSLQMGVEKYYNIYKSLITK
ncbi:MAG: glycosyltransferase family 4 protein [Bacteroidales bacterium]|jgi:glycosyltransferase involved in cell wall biosynthesis|nr:glycosyltransferase [Bacteroidales bacterium]MCK9498221.1 glycosyltransferase [Bacteroidales bacterium]MDY0313608.1 glycosyltransferase [Bacteroidales bacterium]NLB87154.1 glycosyltransferase family 4 protein [Bacteroidales bacterium]